MKALQSQGFPFDLSKALPPSEWHSEGHVVEEMVEALMQGEECLHGVRRESIEDRAVD